MQLTLGYAKWRAANARFGVLALGGGSARCLPDIGQHPPKQVLRTRFPRVDLDWPDRTLVTDVPCFPGPEASKVALDPAIEKRRRKGRKLRLLAFPKCSPCLSLLCHQAGATARATNAPDLCTEDDPVTLRIPFEEFACRRETEDVTEECTKEVT